MKWSPQQAAALGAANKWLKAKNGNQVFRLFGFAGTGKSTLAMHLAEGVNTVCYAAFTGKAALVMRSRGCKGAKTIHALIYKPDDEGEAEDPSFKINRASPVATADLVIIDEVSMVGEDVAQDLLSFGTKILVLGDPEQLPPVEGPGFFTSVAPDIMLTEIHRQAADNPIIRLSIDVREGRKLEVGNYGDSKVILRKNVDQQEILDADQVLVGINRTRANFNMRIRQLRGRNPDTPEIGDKLVCLRNDRKKGLLNGQLFFVQAVKAGRGAAIKLKVQPEDGREDQIRDVSCLPGFFDNSDIPWSVRKSYDEFTYGYCLTVHKSQGSQWNNVYLFDESRAFKDDRRKHLYTALTRAAEKITVAI